MLSIMAIQMANINSKLKRTLAVVIGIPLLYLGMSGLFCNKQQPVIQNTVKQRLQQEEYGAVVRYVVDELENHPEYANQITESGLETLAGSNSYNNNIRKHMAKFTISQAEKNPEITDYFGPNARHYMKKQAIKESASTIVNNVKDTFKEGYKILNGE